MTQQPLKVKNRTPEQLQEHYEVEKELANRLRNASRQERRSLYTSLYDERYKRFPSQKHQKQMRDSISRRIRLLKRFLNQDITFLEIGPGNCGLSFEVAKYVMKVYAVDVSDERSKHASCPQNFESLLSDGCSIPLPSESIDIAYSNQLMEHLHPDDALEQLQHIYNALIPGGIYICITPNKLSGPHDISKYFDTVATGFHLKEYTFTELSTLFKQVGFSMLRNFVGGGGWYARCPVVPFIVFEKLLSRLPYALRRPIMHSFPSKQLLNIRLVGTK